VDSYKSLKEEAWEANMEIPRRNLAIYTWGNVSAFDRGKSVFAIKPSGVVYDKLTPESMVIVDLEGKVVEGNLNPSSDTETHKVLYKTFPNIRGITHTHSTYAVAWAQAARSVPVFGTTHADHGAESIPCTAFMDAQAVKNNYELETGNLIVKTFAEQKKRSRQYAHGSGGRPRPLCLGKRSGPIGIPCGGTGRSLQDGPAYRNAFAGCAAAAQPYHPQTLGAQARPQCVLRAEVANYCDNNVSAV
jgi:L-ribulose-5-phosphate 4-epimerase